MPKKSPRKSPKRRKRGYKKGIHVSPKAGVCNYRSGWEQLYMQWLDDNDDIISYEYENVEIEYLSNVRTGKKRRYYPDFLINSKESGRVLVEIKPSRKVHHKVVMKKTLAAEDWCKAQGIKFEIITEKELKALKLL